MFPAWAQTDLGSLGDMRTALMGGRTGGISCQEGQGAEADTQKEKGKDPQSCFPTPFARSVLFPHGFIVFHLSKNVFQLFPLEILLCTW